MIYKITFPNGKIYVGSDVTDTLTYFGSMQDGLVAADFDELARRDFTIRKQILWESSAASDTEVRCVEADYIRRLRANDPV